ncbi:hypothetical protein VTK73DRAFT_1154 [Phialemonium thermophilum]|uniref:Uncharacterized protein n=1 Tax=Phialemonium thermophilum TaxID=223376 RepID=A0ABR3VTW2_9PEZI
MILARTTQSGQAGQGFNRSANGEDPWAAAHLASEPGHLLTLHWYKNGELGDLPHRQEGVWGRCRSAERPELEKERHGYSSGSCRQETENGSLSPEYELARLDIIQKSPLDYGIYQTT